MAKRRRLEQALDRQVARSAREFASAVEEVIAGCIESRTASAIQLEDRTKERAASDPQVVQSLDVVFGEERTTVEMVSRVVSTKKGVDIVFEVKRTPPAGS